MKKFKIIILLALLAGCASAPEEPQAPPQNLPSWGGGVDSEQVAREQAAKERVRRVAEARERQKRALEARREQEMAQRRAEEERRLEERRRQQDMALSQQPPPMPSAAPPSAAPKPAKPKPPARPKPSPPSPPSITPTELVEVNRYPTMEAPDRVNPDQAFSVMVSLTEELITETVEIVQGQSDELGRLKLNLPEQQEPWEIDVVLSASGFDFTSANRGKIFLPKVGDSSPAMFDLVPRESDRLKADRKLYATFWHKGQYLARVQKPIRVESPVQQMTACNQSTARAAELDAVVASAEIARLSEERVTPDLTIYMRRDWDSCNSTDYHITLSSPHVPTEHERITLPTDIAEWLIPKFKQFSISGRSLPASKEEDEEEDDEEDEEEFVTRDYMVGFGQQLYQEFAPASFVRVYERLQKDLGAEFKTIQIYTDEPSIPWELMVPFGSDQALGLSHAIGRWIIPKHRSNFTVPEQHLQIGKVYLVTPAYEGNLKLYATAAESRFISDLFTHNSEHVDARYSEVKSLLQSSDSALIHYSGHGYAQRDDSKNVVDYGLILEDERLKALNWRGILANKQNASLMFFNACEVGLAEKTAGFVDGWSQVLTDTGSRGFISSLWELGDRGAAGFSKRFYTELNEQLLAGENANIAEMIRRSKLKFNRSENPTDVAYVFYGDVGLNVEFVAPSSD